MAAGLGRSTKSAVELHLNGYLHLTFALRWIILFLVGHLVKQRAVNASYGFFINLSFPYIVEHLRGFSFTQAIEEVIIKFNIISVREEYFKFVILRSENAVCAI